MTERNFEDILTAAIKAMKDEIDKTAEDNGRTEGKPACKDAEACECAKPESFQRHNRVSVLWDGNIDENNSDPDITVDIDIQASNETEIKAEAMAMLLAAYARMLAESEVFCEAGITWKHVLSEMASATGKLAIRAIRQKYQKIKNN